MAVIWTPDICPTRPQCQIEMDRDTGEPTNVIILCQHHASLGLSDGDAMSNLINTCRAKEQSRYAAKLAINLPEEDGSLPWSLNSDGSIIIKTGVSGQELIAAQEAVDVVLQNFPGASISVVE
jgi:hypothetical protein